MKHLVLNDNKITQIQLKIGNLAYLETLLLQNNMIVDIPSSMYKLQKLTHLGLDWFAYLNTDYVSVHTKVIKARHLEAESTE